MSGPRGGIIDWTKPEQVIAYRREWRIEHRDELNARRRAEWAERREAKRNKPAGDGVKGRGRPSTGFLDVAYSTENYHDELNWRIDKEKLRRSIEE